MHIYIKPCGVWCCCVATTEHATAWVCLPAGRARAQAHSLPAKDGCAGEQAVPSALLSQKCQPSLQVPMCLQAREFAWCKKPRWVNPQHSRGSIEPDSERRTSASSLMCSAATAVLASSGVVCTQAAVTQQATCLVSHPQQAGLCHVGHLRPAPTMRNPTC